MVLLLRHNHTHSGAAGDEGAAEGTKAAPKGGAQGTPSSRGGKLPAIAGGRFHRRRFWLHHDAFHPAAGACWLGSAAAAASGLGSTAAAGG